MAIDEIYSKAALYVLHIPAKHDYASAYVIQILGFMEFCIMQMRCIALKL